MSRKIKVTLSPSSFRAAAREVQKYRDGLQAKCQTFVERLAEVGIQTAAQNAGSYGKYITFAVETTPEQNGVKAVMAATNTGIIRSEWRTKDGVKTADVSPLLMAEFGSGLKANNPKAGELGMGTGTFPGQTHAEDPEGWWWMDLDGNWHHSSGVAPTMPMFKAAQEMERNLMKIAREVFGG